MDIILYLIKFVAFINITYSQHKQYKMGTQQSNSKTNNSQMPFSTDPLSQFQKRFIVASHPLDPTSSSLFLLHQRLSPHKFILRIINTNDQEDSNRLESMVCRKLANKPDGRQLVKIDHYLIEHQKSYCNEIYRCYLLFKIQEDCTLNQWIISNKVNKTAIPENIIIKGLNSLIQGVAWLKFYGHPHPNINSNSVYVDKQTNEFSLGDPWMMVGDVQTQYPSPEKLKKMNSQIEEYDQYLGSLFSIGMIGLQILGVDELDKVYRRNYRLDTNKLQSFIHQIEHENLKNLLADLLGTPEQREQLLIQRRMKNKSSKNKVKKLVPKQLSSKMSSIRKSVTSEHEHQSVVTKNSIPEPIKQTIGVIQAMNPNIYSGSDKNDQPIMDEDPLMLLKTNGQVNGQVPQLQQKNSPNLQSVPTMPTTHNTRGVNHLNWGGGSTKIRFNNRPYAQPQPQTQNVSPFTKVQKKGIYEPVTSVTPVTANFFSNPSKILHSPPTLSKQPQKQSFPPKQEQKPLGTKTSIRSSDSFFNDHANHIKNELKQLQNKVSEVLSNNGMQSENGKQSTSEFANSIFINEKQEVQDERVYKINETVKQVQEENKQQKQKNEPANESFDYININESEKQSSSKHEEEQQLQKQPEPEKKQEQWINPIMPSKSVSKLNDIIDLTIPQESDQQSLSGSQVKPTGQYVEEIYDNGGKYLGFMRDGRRNGQGTFYYRDGGYYDGHWKENMMNGYGKLFYDNGKIAYEGQWYRDEFHGRGKVYNDAPEVIEGPFDYHDLSNTELHWVFYEGDLVHDMKIGYGRMMLSNGQFYEGEYQKDFIHGKGLYHRVDGTVIKGIWEEGILIRELSN